MSKSALPGYRRLQPQQQTEFENPQWKDEAPPPYEMAVKQLQLQHKQPHEVSSPVVATSKTTVTVEGGRGRRKSRAPRSRALAGCCSMGNEQSALAILFGLLGLSLIAVVICIYILTLGLTDEFAFDLKLGLAFAVPTAILFPGSLAALHGVFNGKTAGLSVLICILEFYVFVVLSSMIYFYIGVIITCLTEIVTYVSAQVNHPIAYDVELMMTTFRYLLYIGLKFAYIIVITAITTVLSDYRKTIRRRGSSTPQ